MRKLRILALDIGTKTGWAHTCGLSGTWDFKVQRDESSGMRLLRFRAKLREVFESEGIDLVFFEAVRYGGPGMGGAMVVMSELQGVVKLWCESKKIAYKGISSSAIKKYATGKGNAGKPLMLKAARKKWGREVVDDMDDNEIDAKWLLEFGKTTL